MPENVKVTVEEQIDLVQTACDIAFDMDDGCDSCNDQRKVRDAVIAAIRDVAALRGVEKAAAEVAVCLVGLGEVPDSALDALKAALAAVGWEWERK
jgi:hypothetical protein